MIRRLFATMLLVLGRRRWEVGGTLVLLVFLLPALYLLVPYATDEISTAWTMMRLGTPAARLPGVDEQIRRTQTELNRLIRESRVVAGRPVFSEPAVLERVYTAADSIGFDLRKVELGEGLATGKSVEIPLEFNGEGSYNAIGRLVETLENLPWTTRVRRLSIARETETRGSLSGELLIITGSGEGVLP